MRNTRKWIAVVLILLFCVGMPTTAFAAENAGQMTVRYRKPNSYMVTIPSSVDLFQTTTAQIKATYDIEPGKILKVRISNGVNTNGQVTLKRSDNETAMAQIEQGSSTVTPSTVLAQFSGYSSTQSVGGTLTFIPPASAKAGDYSATITFSFWIE